MQADRLLLNEVLLDYAPALARPAQFEARDASYERTPESDQLHSGQSRSHAEMRAGAECQMLASVASPDIEVVWLRKACRITIGGT